jgi:hypothetical protein
VSSNYFLIVGISKNEDFVITIFEMPIEERLNTIMNLPTT